MFNITKLPIVTSKILEKVQNINNKLRYEVKYSFTKDNISGTLMIYKVIDNNLHNNNKIFINTYLKTTNIEENITLIENCNYITCLFSNNYQVNYYINLLKNHNNIIDFQIKEKYNLHLPVQKYIEIQIKTNDLVLHNFNNLCDNTKMYIKNMLNNKLLYN